MEAVIMKGVNLGLCHVKAISQLEKDCMPKPWGAAQIKNSMDRADFYGVGAVGVNQLENELTAYLLAVKGMEDWELWRIGTHPHSRGQGFAQALLTTFIVDASAQNAKAILLEVSSFNLGPIMLYQKMGFEQIATRKGYYCHSDGTQHDALIMRLIVSSDHFQKNRI